MWHDWNTLVKTAPVAKVAQAAITLRGDVYAGAGGPGYCYGPVNFIYLAGGGLFPPTVTLTRPQSGATFVVPATVQIEALAETIGGTIEGVEFYADQTELGEDATAPYGLVWSGMAPGHYDLWAVATDSFAARGTSAVVSVTVERLDFCPLAGLVRGPYLQKGSPTSVTVRWRTDQPTTSQVRYGLESLDQIVEGSELTTEHEMVLGGLRPDTKYVYAVGACDEMLAGGPDCFFVTTPTNAKPTRVWVLGDSGTADLNAAAVRDAYYAWTGDRHTDLWLMLGDNAYPLGADVQYQQAVFDMYPDMLRKSVLWPTLGNHDTAFSIDPPETIPYFTIFSLPRNAEAGGAPSGTEKYYSFDYGHIHFVCLDSMSSDRSSNGVMCAWLEADLAVQSQEWLIAFWHHPPYSKGSHDSDYEPELIKMRENVLPILERHGVDLVLAGHSHGYERSVLLQGHYGSSATLSPEMILDDGSGRPNGGGPYVKRADGRGSVYVVAGSSGQATYGNMDHPVMFVSFLRLGSLVLDIDGHVLQAQFLRETGEVDDSFTIEKRVTGPELLRITSFQLQHRDLTLTWNSVPGREYRLQQATNLPAQDWRDLEGSIQATDLQTSRVVPVGAGTRRAFFRVVAPAP